MLNYKTITKLLLLPSLVYVFNATFESLAFNFYTTYSVDTLSHFLGGLSIAYSVSYALSLFEKKHWITIQKNILRDGIIITTVMATAVLWEFYEFIHGQLFNSVMQPSVADTIKDLCMGMIGAIIFCVGASNKKLPKA